VYVTVGAGTGSIAGGRNADGEQAVVGGWGWLLGDEGSGFWIGRMGLQAAIKALDARGPRSALPGAICGALGLGSLHEMIGLVYQTPECPMQIAQLAPIVAEQARKGDLVARTIVASAGRELGSMARAVIRHLGIEQEVFAIVPFGSVFKVGSLVLDALHESVLQSAPGARIVVPRYESVVGTLNEALAVAGVDVARVWPTLEDSLTRVARLQVAVA
jgi:N-acetylglucosamine kinase-like BadF-type ATPase